MTRVFPLASNKRERSLLLTKQYSSVLSKLSPTFKRKGDNKLETAFVKHYAPTICLSPRVSNFVMSKPEKGSALLISIEILRNKHVL